MNDKPIALVFTMGKVGSSTVMNALRSIGRNPERGYSSNLEYLLPPLDYEKIITMVRDLVARNASVFFERLAANKDISEIYMRDLIFDFVDGFDHLEPLRWFDEWVRFVLADDVLTEPFSRKNGWHIINDRFLLIRTESLMDKLPEAFAALFGVDPSEVSIEHRAETFTTRKYGEVYREFLDNLKLPKNLLDDIYGSGFMEHFYYKKEITEFRKRWS